MAFTDLVLGMDENCIKLLNTVSFSFTPQSTGIPQPNLEGLKVTPGLFEDFTSGTRVVRLFVPFSTMSPLPVQGDLIVLEGVTYLIVDLDADIMGRAILKLRSE